VLISTHYRVLGKRVSVTGVPPQLQKTLSRYTQLLMVKIDSL